MSEEPTALTTPPTAEEPPAEAPQAAHPAASVVAGNRKRNRALLIVLALVVIGLWLGLKWYIRSQVVLETDNAFIEARIVPVSAKVSGTVARVLVNDNQHVTKGELLLEIDPRDYQLQTAQASAGVGMALNESGADQQKVAGAQAALQSARARQQQATADVARGENLFSREVIPKEQLERLTTARRVAEAQMREAEEGLKRAQAEAGQSGAGGGKAKLQQRQALLDETQLRLSYTKVYAARDGYITRKSVEAGSNIQAGQPLMAIVPLQEAWITANYKERQLTHIKPGQQVSFRVDSYPGQTFSGRVDSIMAGTGAAFSLLPPENATGNYVKVVQRIPVKISIDGSSDPAHLLRVGMSVVPAIATGRSAADVLKELNPF